MTNCPICRSSSISDLPSHPDVVLRRCRACTHVFTDLSAMRSFENYEEDYFDDEHSRWFDHPNTALFDRIGRLIPRQASVLDVGCGRGDFLRHLARTRPDLQLTGIDL